MEDGERLATCIYTFVSGHIFAFTVYKSSFIHGHTFTFTINLTLHANYKNDFVVHTLPMYNIFTFIFIHTFLYHYPYLYQHSDLPFIIFNCNFIYTKNKLLLPLPYVALSTMCRKQSPPYTPYPSQLSPSLFSSPHIHVLPPHTLYI